ncbi:MAG: PAS domain-containing sensor histidine kinase [Phycisphaerae bacterium]
MLPPDFYKRLCEQASIGIVIADAEFRICMLNSQAAILFEVDARKVVGEPIEVLVPANRRNVTKKLLARAVAVSRPLEYRVRRNDAAKKRCLSILVDPILQADRTEGVCLWIQDLTRRMDMEKRLAEIEKLASLGQLAGGLAHHFNNILGGIVTAVDHALRTNDEATSHRTLEMISDGIGKAVVLTRKLLDFSTPDLPEQNLVDLTEAVISFTEKAEPRLTAAGRQIELEMKSIPIRAVHPGKMHQILQTLLSNSEQAFGVRGGKIKLTLESDGQQIRLLFCDDGPGIPPGLADRIFEPFFTTRGSLGGGSEGNLGLGLTLAQRMAEDVGGTLVYSPEESIGGACFVITFPLHRTE